MAAVQALSHIPSSSNLDSKDQPWGIKKAILFLWPIHSLLKQPTELTGCAQHGDACCEAVQLSGKPG